MAPFLSKIRKMASGTDFWILLTCRQNLGWLGNSTINFPNIKKPGLMEVAQHYRDFIYKNIWGLEVITSAESRPWDKAGGWGRSPKIFFRPFGPQFGLKMRGGAGPLGPSPGSGCTTHKIWRSTYHTWLIMSWEIFSSPKCFCANNKENK